jgi:hypothetical protein
MRIKVILVEYLVQIEFWRHLWGARGI